MKLKVISLNIWFGKYLDEVIDFVRSQNPDVVLLQEVPNGLHQELDHGVADSYQRLLVELGMQGVFAPMFEVEARSNFQMGVAILSKFSLYRSEMNFYHLRQVKFEPGLDMTVRFPGMLLEAEFVTPVGLLRFMTTHFLWSMHPEITNSQKSAARSLVNRLAKYENFVLGGDFNVTDDSEIYNLVSKGLVDDRPKGLTRSLHPEIHKLGIAKDLAVDYVFHKGSKFRLVETSVPVVPISDHLPVVVEYMVG